MNYKIPIATEYRTASNHAVSISHLEFSLKKLSIVTKLVRHLSEGDKRQDGLSIQVGDTRDFFIFYLSSYLYLLCRKRLLNLFQRHTFHICVSGRSSAAFSASQRADAVTTAHRGSRHDNTGKRDESCWCVLPHGFQLLTEIKARLLTSYLHALLPPCFKNLLRWMHHLA